MITLWGLKTCDTCKKARAWLDSKGVLYGFKDVRADGLTAEQLEAWLLATGTDTLINRRRTTWRGLDAAHQSMADSDDTAIALMLAHPALIKRPVFVFDDGEVVVGFAKPQQAAVEARI